MELKEILNQNSQQASSNLNYFSKQKEYLNSQEEVSNQSLNLLSVISKITESRNSRNSHLQARYGVITSALIKHIRSKKSPYMQAN
jgi:hypothetical protein